MKFGNPFVLRMKILISFGRNNYVIRYDRKNERNKIE